MRISESVVVPASPSTVFSQVADLTAYPAWLGLVHTAEAVPVSDGERPAWSVELRARVGPFARSKQLRMERCELVADQLAVFERTEVDGRRHARWALRAELEGLDEHSTRLTMHLAYDGALWTGGLLERVLEEEIRRGRVGLVRLVNDEPRR
jgi:ribosome-associated toxin RatA of RatAB toxin-antitoxin module